MKDHYNIENITGLATDFIYPLESIPKDMQAEIEHYTTQLASDKLYEAMNRLLYVLKEEKKPQIFLTTLLQATKCLDNYANKSAVADGIGVTRQAYNYHDKQLHKKLFNKVNKLNGKK